MKTRWIPLILISVLLLSGCGKEAKPVSPFTAASRTWIDSPLDGSVIPLGPVEIVGHASSPQGIASFKLLLNGQPLADPPPDAGSLEDNLRFFRHPWRPAAPGTYLIELQALDASGARLPIAQAHVRITAAITATPTATATLEPTSTPTPTKGPTPTITPTPPPCDMAKFLIHVTIPDGTDLAPGQAFTKIWRIVNVGSCTWTPAYQVFFLAGDQMDAADSVPFPSNVAPLEKVDLAVDMVAPMDPGTYAGYWKLRNPNGDVFSFPNGGELYLKIDVVERAQPAQGCMVYFTAGPARCVVPCPEGAHPGTPCTP